MSIIPIVMATDNNYFFYMMVTLASILKTANWKYVYEIHLLCSSDIDDVNLLYLDDIRKKYSKNNIIIHYMNDAYSDVEMTISHISHITYYRLDIANILKDYDKCIYLDVDVVVKENLWQMYSENIDRYYVAGVRAPSYMWPLKDNKQRSDILGIPNMNQYINAGVLLFNLKELRRYNISNIFHELINFNFQSQDQDIINKVCYDKIKLLPPKYNVMTKYDWDNDVYDRNNMLGNAYTFYEWKEAKDNPAIIHYASPIKPWNGYVARFATDWWEIALELPGCGSILGNLFKFLNKVDFINITDENKKFVHVSNSWSYYVKSIDELNKILNENPKVYIYGTGKVGNSIKKYIQDRYTNVDIKSMIVTNKTSEDKNIIQYNEDNIDVSLPIIIAMSVKYRNQVIKKLNNGKVKKIITLSPSFTEYIINEM